MVSLLELEHFNRAVMHYAMTVPARQARICVENYEMSAALATLAG
jgi:hypothetical protein